MVQIIKTILFIKTSVLVLVTFIRHFNNDMDKDSHILGLKQNKSNNNEHEKYDITINEKGNKGINKKSDKSSLNKAQYYMEVIDYNNGMFDGKHFHFKKKWIKKKDYDNFIERNRRICDISLRKIRFRKYGTGVAMFVIFFLFAGAFYVLPRLTSLNTAWKKLEEGSDILKTLHETIKSYGDTVMTSIYLTLYSVLMLILIIVLVIGICRVLGNNEKYNKIKLMSEQSAY
ncbi:fam-m protein [Plasmodium malariae]|uniref:Fam-m protein n=1 Tax=Plasmodium malariae TaxID=5858 RepID=A0A1D3JIC4_PLAMA|nr:fam-m protein [Plasmodium malariae]SBT86097.1 fam-m protein [Plasmodium malariae]